MILAALSTQGDFAAALGEGAPSPGFVASLTSVESEDAEPVGVFLRSNTVKGFREIGPAVTLPFRPAPGLSVVAGRNGSGKSTLAEGLDFTLTERNSRWSDRTAVWSQNWRKLHAGATASIHVDVAEQGAGATTIGVDWPDRDDVEVTQAKTWVQLAGKKREDRSVLGWAAALEMYRPLLSCDELGGILKGRLSDLHDQLHKLLGLEQLTEAMARLEAEVKELKEPGLDAAKAKKSVRPQLESHDDLRAARALTQVKKHKPDLGAVRSLVTEGAAHGVPQAWQRAERLAAADAGDLVLKCDALRSAADSEAEEARRTDALAAECG